MYCSESKNEEIDDILPSSTPLNITIDHEEPNWKKTETSMNIENLNDKTDMTWYQSLVESRTNKTQSVIDKHVIDSDFLKDVMSEDWMKKS